MTHQPGIPNRPDRIACLCVGTHRSESPARVWRGSPATLVGATTRPCTSGSRAGSRSDGYLFDTHPENHLRVITRPGTLMANERLPSDQWSHVAATFGDRKLRGYLNGREIAEMNAPGGTITATALPLRMGADSSGSSRFVGLMDEVRIYRRVLKPEEIAKLAPNPDKS